MSFPQVVTGSYSISPDPPTGQQTTLTLFWSVLSIGSCNTPVQTYCDYGYASAGENNTAVQNINDGGSFSGSAGSRDADRSFHRQGVCSGDCGAGFGGDLTAKLNAMLATASTPTSSAVTSNSATIACNYFPNTKDSTATVKMQYRKLGDSTWIDAPGGTDTQSGYTQKSLSRNLTGLLASTTYEFRLDMTRTTNNQTTFDSSISTFTTSAAAPGITTNAATGIGFNAATLNGTVVTNGLDLRVRFGWGTSDAGGTPGSWANLTSYQAFSSGTQAFSQALSGLSASTQYFFRAFVEWPSPGFGSGDSGVTLNFTTTADPGVVAAQSGPKLPTETAYNAKYGVARTFYFTVDVPGGTNSDRFLSAAVPWIAGDVQISKDGGAFSNVSTLPTRIGSTSLYAWAADAAELQAADVVVQLVDADGPAWRDHTLRIQTKLLQGQVDIDATAIGGNADAMVLTGVGTGFGLDAVGGSSSDGDIFGALASHALTIGAFAAGGASPMLASSAVASDDYYNGALLVIVGGVGAGQSRVITDYVGSTRQALLNRSWAVSPNAGSIYMVIPGEDVWNIGPAGELAAMPADTASYGDKIEFVFQRFAFRRTEDSASPRKHKLYKSDGTTVLASATYSDSGGAGGTYDIAKLA